MDLFWDDAALDPNGNKIKGIEAIRRFCSTPLDTVHALTRYEIKLDEICSDKNLAHSIGTREIAWTATTGRKPDVQRGDPLLCRDLCQTQQTMENSQTPLERKITRG